MLIRDVDSEIIERLKARAARNGRSLQAELRDVLERSAASDWEAADAALRRVREVLGDRTFSDSTPLIREDRDR